MLVTEFSGQAGELVLHYSPGHDRTTAVLDVNGDRAGDMAIQLAGQQSMTEGWAL